ncbi:MAG: DUF2063 domain-containing protein [Hyphomicrobiaceae bacterium]
MPTLLDIQQAMYRSLAGRDDKLMEEYVLADGLTVEARLNVYRNNVMSSLTTALSLAYPAVHSLVGEEFFEGAAAIFIEQHIPRSPCLDEYGAEFADFLEQFPPAAGLPYLPGVARLEWAVNVALHAADVDALDLHRLTAAEATDDGQIAFVLHPSVGLVHDAHPIDAIWRTVLAQDDAAIAAIDLDAGPAWLLVSRAETGIDVMSISEGAWRFTSALLAGQSVDTAITAAAGIDTTMVLAEHLASGRVIRLKLIDLADTTK